MKPYALGTYSLGAAPRFAALVIDGRAAPLAELVRGLPGIDPAPFGSVLALLEAWDANLRVLDALAAQPSADVSWHRVDDLRTHPPVDLPRQVFCTGANYR